jgi:hypothetical protein
VTAHPTPTLRQGDDITLLLQIASIVFPGRIELIAATDQMTAWGGV